MVYQNEKQLLKIIKYIPLLLLVFMSIIIIVFLYIEDKDIFSKQKDEIHKNYIHKSKSIIKERVENTYNYIQYMKETTEVELIKSLKEETSKVHAIAYSIYEKNKDTKSEKEIKKFIADAIRPIRFNNGRGYFFLNDKTTYKNAMHGVMPSLENVSLYNLKDAKGTYIAQLMYKALEQKDETALEWYWYKPGNKTKQYKKIGYVRNFEPYNWLIGTGEYVEDFEKQVQEVVLKRIATTKFDESGYIFVLRYDGKILSHFNKKLINKNALEIPDVKEDILNLINIAKKQKEGYHTYSHVKHPQSNVPSNKTSYIKAIDSWKWVIGTGFYEDDVNKIIEKKKKEVEDNILSHMKHTVIVATILAITLFILSYLLSSIVNKKIKAYKKEINKHLHKQVEQQKILSQQAKMAAMGEMIGNIAHQWRQPLSSITSNATGMIVQKQVNVLDDSSLIKGLEDINNKAKYLSKTIDDFRNFYNNTDNKSEFSLREAIDETFSIVNAQLKENNIIVKEDIVDATIKNSKNEFIQVLINIINNAKDVLKDLENDRLIFVESLKEKNSVIITITDSAGGINSDIIDKIFDPYFTTKHQTQGTGIGLYMSNEIITKHMKGSLKVKNKEFTYNNRTYKGASFKIVLPV